MKTKLATAFILFAFILTGIQVQAEEQTRKVDPFSEISLRIGAKVHLEQGAKQNGRLRSARPSVENVCARVRLCDKLFAGTVCVACSTRRRHVGSRGLGIRANYGLRGANHWSGRTGAKQSA